MLRHKHISLSYKRFLVSYRALWCAAAQMVCLVCAAGGPLDVPGALQLKMSQAALAVQKQVAEQQRADAMAMVSELEEQLENIGAQIATHMQVSGLVALQEITVAAAAVVSSNVGSVMVPNQSEQHIARPYQGLTTGFQRRYQASQPLL